MLRDPNCTIDHERYWCLDVVAGIDRKGKGDVPSLALDLLRSLLVFLQSARRRACSSCRRLNRVFDYIVAYSVFTNTSRTDMLDLVSQLESKLANGGALAFTFIDPHYSSWPGRYDGNNLVWRLEREIYLEGEKGNTLDIDVPGLADEAKDAQWFVLVNGEDLYLETEQTRHYAPEEQRTYHMFYTVNYMRSLFPNAVILPPVNDEMQHCCVIQINDTLIRVIRGYGFPWICSPNRISAPVIRRRRLPRRPERARPRHGGQPPRRSRRALRAIPQQTGTSRQTRVQPSRSASRPPQTQSTTRARRKLNHSPAPGPTTEPEHPPALDHHHLQTTRDAGCADVPSRLASRHPHPERSRPRETCRSSASRSVIA